MTKTLTILLVIVMSCQEEKTFNNYNRNDFIEVQGIVFESKEIEHFLDESTWDIDYFFKVNEKSYKGKQKGFNTSMTMGQTLIILVHKENPKINFFKEIGVLTE